MLAVANRVLGAVPLPTLNGLRRLKLTAKTFFRWIPATEPWNVSQVVASFTDHRRKIYERARLSLMDREFCKADGRINAFVKAELYNPKDKVNPDPRVIQARSVRYNLLLAQYLRPLEHKILKQRSERGLRIFAKGRNSFERASDIRDKFKCFGNTTCLSIDASRFDKHVSREVLEIEHSVYKRAYPDDRVLQRLLDYQLSNVCVTRDGVRYLAHGRRMSGDMNTGLGNCVVMVLMVKSIMDRLGIPYEIYDDGDDCLLFFATEHRDRVSKALVSEFLEFGQEIKVENTANNPTEVVFCQSKMIKTMSVGA